MESYLLAVSFDVVGARATRMDALRKMIGNKIIGLLATCQRTFMLRKARVGFKHCRGDHNDDSQSQLRSGLGCA